MFRATGKIEAADNCQSSIARVLKVLHDGPDGVSQVSVGEASICWDCGFVGIARSEQKARRWEAKNGKESVPSCNQCLSQSINSVRGVQPDGSDFPWIELK